VPFLKCGPGPSPAIISQVPLVRFEILEALKFKERELVSAPVGHEYDNGPAIFLAVVSLTSIEASTCSKPTSSDANPIIAKVPRHFFNIIKLMFTLRRIINKVIFQS